MTKVAVKVRSFPFYLVRSSMLYYNGNYWTTKMVEVWLDLSPDRSSG